MILLLFFCVMFSSNSFAEWKWFIADVKDKNFYLDFERIRNVDNLTYYWVLTDFPKVDEYGELSTITYREGNCRLFRDRDLEIRGFTKNMGKGIMKEYKPKTKEFETPFPGTVNEEILKAICNS